METTTQSPDPARATRGGFDLARLLTLAERRVVARITSALASAGGSVEEWRVTSLLADGEGHPMSEIAEHVLLAPPTLTKIVDRMVSDNLVYRRVDETDRRRVLVFLSERGVQAHRRLSEAVAGEQAEIEILFGAEETALLGPLLTRLSDRL
ncbi:MarR family transcriptional regulator [Spongiactinospora sp. TRM90649]|uniref:MarR family winged helix-turn-helix transcriptional regulator n=1 Tax=Spongiactinospora sp. TRM90649 TaxID=3031114 RepID=UPI0023F9804C|nr:MarR family transcriptional regulator [Spongiactinospora sp. TRM90649]MDF5754261.1 MarR family transcriptional regulator [Spongiactinospora sp. TRM90649]